MDKSQIWPTIHAERRALATDLENLTAEQWATGSLCDGWTVQDVLAHMTATAQMNPPKFLAKFVANGFSLPRIQNKDIARINSGNTLAAFKAQIDSRGAPPGPIDTWLGETLIHADDIRRPLGIAHDYPADAAVRVADSYKKTNLVMGAKNRIAGLKLLATDTDWSHGDGPEVQGPIMALVAAMAGRTAALADLHGAGLDTLTARG